MSPKPYAHNHILMRDKGENTRNNPKPHRSRERNSIHSESLHPLCSTMYQHPRHQDFYNNCDLQDLRITRSHTQHVWLENVVYVKLQLVPCHFRENFTWVTYQNQAWLLEFLYVHGEIDLSTFGKFCRSLLCWQNPDSWSLSGFLSCLDTAWYLVIKRV